MDCAAPFAMRSGRRLKARAALIDFDAIAANLYPQGFAHGWQAVPCVENHDIVKVGSEPAHSRSGRWLEPRSWYARSRSRFATGLLLTAPGIPQLFMGQEFLRRQAMELGSHDSLNLIWWAGLNTGSDQAMVNHLRFTQDLIRLRWNHPALRGDNVNPFHVHDQNRVIAFHRWLEGTGQDVIVVATLAEDHLVQLRHRLPVSRSVARSLQQRRLRQLGQSDCRRQRRSDLRVRRPAARLPGVRKHRDPSEWNGSLRSQCVRLALTALSQAAILDFAIQSRK